MSAKYFSKSATGIEIRFFTHVEQNLHEGIVYKHMLNKVLDLVSYNILYVLRLGFEELLRDWVCIKSRKLPIFVHIKCGELFIRIKIKQIVNGSFIKSILNIVPTFNRPKAQWHKGDGHPL